MGYLDDVTLGGNCQDLIRAGPQVKPVDQRYSTCFIAWGAFGATFGCRAVGISLG